MIGYSIDYIKERIERWNTIKKIYGELKFNRLVEEQIEYWNTMKKIYGKLEFKRLDRLREKKIKKLKIRERKPPRLTTVHKQTDTKVKNAVNKLENRCIRCRKSKKLYYHSNFCLTCYQEEYYKSK